jgi:hypothetical protein
MLDLTSLDVIGPRTFFVVELPPDLRFRVARVEEAS